MGTPSHQEEPFHTLLPPGARYTQEHHIWCGATALRCVMARYGVEMPHEEIAEHMSVTPQGFTLADLKHAAMRAGFHAMGYHGKSTGWVRDTVEQGLTPILLLRGVAESKHFVVACGTLEDHLIIHDPAAHGRTIIAIPTRDVARTWYWKEHDRVVGGYALLVQPQEFTLEMLQPARPPSAR